MTTIDMRNIKKIINPSKATNNKYKKVTLVSGNTETVLWKGTWKYTIKLGAYVSSAKYKIDSGSWTTISSNTTVEIDSGKTLYIDADSYSSESATYQYTYTMTDYNFNISRTEANNGGEVTLYRTASAVDRYYTITWKNYDGSVLKTDTVIHDGTPSYSGSTPTKAADNTYTYSFSSWSPSIATVTGDATYTAQFSESYINYTITWEWQSSYGNWTSTTETYHYNDTPSRALPSDVTSGNNKQKCMSWNSLANVTANRTITATYQQQYYIEINRVRCTCPSSDGWYNSGESITFTANTNCAFSLDGSQTTYSPTINSGGTYNGSADYVYCTTSGTNCSANKTGWMAYGETITWTADSHYHFGNNNSTTTITDSAIPESISKTANINTYTITWKNYDGTVLETDYNVEYGITPTYDSSTPTKPSDNYNTYSYNGWTPSVSTVTGDKTYTATFSESTREYTSNVYLGSYCSQIRAKVGSGSWTAWSSSTITLSHTYNQTIYWEATAYSTSSTYTYRGATSGSFSGSNGNSYTVTFTRATSPKRSDFSASLYIYYDDDSGENDSAATIKNNYDDTITIKDIRYYDSSSNIIKQYNNQTYTVNSGSSKTIYTGYGYQAWYISFRIEYKGYTFNYWTFYHDQLSDYTSE